MRLVQQVSWAALEAKHLTMNSADLLVHPNEATRKLIGVASRPAFTLLVQLLVCRVRCAGGKGVLARSSAELFRWASWGLWGGSLNGL